MEVAMYIQPYEPPQELGLGSSPTGYTAPGQTFAPLEVPYGGADSVGRSLPWTESMPGLTDGSGALQDGPFGSLGLGGMLESLAAMMQQLAQMMQSLIARMGNGNPLGGGAFGHTGEFGHTGCTQGLPQPGRRYPLDAANPTQSLIAEE